MSTMKKGSSGQAVIDLQGQLHRLGYDPGSIDGDFGPKTHRAVIAFQKAHSLEPDGIVGPRTTAALRSALNEFLEEGNIPGDPTSPPSIDRTLRLDSEQYYRTNHKKDLIVLHHTAGGSAASTVSWWNSNKSRIATAYIIGSSLICVGSYSPTQRVEGTCRVAQGGTVLRCESAQGCDTHVPSA